MGSIDKNQAKAGFRPTRREFVAGAAVGVCALPLATIASAAPSQTNPARLFYKRPAASWNEALPIGNGRLGAMIFGGVAQERIQLNEDTLWAGSPYTPDNPDALAALPLVRKLLQEEKFEGARALVSERMMAKPLRQMPYGTLGDIFLDFVDPLQPASYERSLDIEQAISAVRYSNERGTISREAFSSWPDKVVVLRLEASGKERISFDIRYRGPRTVDFGPMKLEGSGLTPVQASEPDWLGVAYDGKDKGDETHPDLKIASDGGDAILVTGRNEAAFGIPAGLTFAMKVTALGDGAIESRDGKLSVRNARQVTLIISAATSFVNYHDVSGDPVAIVRAASKAAGAKSYASLKAAHIGEYRSHYAGVSLDLGRTAAAEMPSDQRIAAAETADDPALAMLYFQFARYLMISSSRPGTQPANLQGIWNEGVNPPWGSKYTININTEMNYWLAHPAGLGACFEPVVRMVEELSVTGAKTAKTMYAARGWVTHHNTDLWRAAAPIDGPHAGTWPTGGAWLCNALWDRYEYVPDEQYLRRIYPLLKGAALFFLDTLIEDPAGRGLIVSPSLSPENRHVPGVSLCAGPAMDSQILRDLFANTVAAGQKLGLDSELLATIAATRARLAKDKVGAQGQLQEWLEDWDARAVEQQHRHVSHLYAVYPSEQINVRDTPDLIKAAKVSLDHRGDRSTGWATAWRICLWARMGDGDRAHSVLKGLLGPTRTYPNMFDAHPPFQIDGNFGGATGILEMLVQSWGGEILLLPALPAVWPSGRVSGVRARGNVTVDMKWRKGSLDSLRLYGPPSARLKLRYKDALHDVVLDAKGSWSGALT
jgi:alpha-L-fucosidase 2